MGRHSAPPQQQSEDDALARLLAAERGLAERLAAAREEADEIVRMAREQAQQIEEACATTIASRSKALAEQYETRLRGDLSEIARESQGIASLFEGVDDTRIEPYVALVLERLLPSLEAGTGR
jgi:vacuolar-type H+-ATPase subunit H